MRILCPKSVKASDQLPILVVQRDGLLQASLGDRLAANTLQFLDQSAIFAGQKIYASRGTRVVRQVKEVDIEVGEVPLHHEAS